MRVRKLLIALGLMVIAGAILALTRNSEPTYAGHTLSHWLKTANPDEATQAVQAIGTNALPCLLLWIGEEPPEWKRNLARTGVVRRHDWLLGNLYATPELAVRGFAILRTNATAAIPALVRIMNDPVRPGAGIVAMRALSYLGEQALPSLTAVLSETNQIRRCFALNVIPDMADNGVPKSSCLVPLLKATTDTSPLVRSFATAAIRRIAPETLTNAPPP